MRRAIFVKIFVILILPLLENYFSNNSKYDSLKYEDLDVKKVNAQFETKISSDYQSTLPRPTPIIVYVLPGGNKNPRCLKVIESGKIGIDVTCSSSFYGFIRCDSVPNCPIAI